jgi:hypothetical protein
VVLLLEPLGEDVGERGQVVPRRGQ